MKNKTRQFKHLESQLKYETLNQELFSHRLRKYYQLIPAVASVYIVAILVFFLLRSGVSFPFSTSSQEPGLSTLGAQLSELRQNLNNLSNDIKTASGSPDTKNLNIRISQLEEGQKNIADSIDLDVNKALTARLLQEKQKTIEVEVSQLQDSQRDLNKRIDSLITALVAIPLGGFVLSLISTFIYYLVSRPKKNSASEGIS